MGQIEERLGALARLIQTDQDALALRLHVSELLESPAFTTSRRSGQFLQYVVEKAVAQQTEALKERTIGVEVFHRPPDYDTGEDAIVRVTASDVRRRLAQHYSASGRLSEFRISLPPGGYAPEVYRDPPPGVTTREPSFAGQGAAAYAGESPSPAPSLRPAALGEEPAVRRATASATAPTAAPDALPPRSRSVTRSVFRVLAVSAAALVLLSAGILGSARRAHNSEFVRQAPWSLLFAPGKPLLVVMADPDLNEIQLLTGKYVSLADYASGKLGCETLQPELQPVCRHALRGDKSSTVDVAALARVAGLAARMQSSVEPLETRSVRLTDLQTHRNVLLLGSRVANPWADLFRDKLDFYVGHDEVTGLQVVYNVRRRPDEAAEYVPTAGPYGSGDNYTLISFLHNLSGDGYALLLTGATHEGMDAAISFMLDGEQLGRARHDCGITRDDTPFQMLLKFKMMAGSPLKVMAMACHQLPAQS